MVKLITEKELAIIHKWAELPEIKYNVITEKANPALDFVAFGIFKEQELVGWATLQNIDYQNGKAEFGIAFPNKPADQIAIIGFRTIIEIFEFAFDELKLNRIYIRPIKSNLRTEYERFGFVTEGIERQAVKRGDVFEDVVVMSILKHEFERRWKNATGSTGYHGGRKRSQRL